ncbi:Transcriptional regulatory protein-like protein [Hapsidospora chrysogenum ATCC 11550]|uniref:Chromatin modification-related protein n=1 Tax=Hapsidospora chrysogenum (strain ATCC 11550 / CBS 779.69 / DSM 880 / IAM 14645 / JCM 23072 / IMI 49137) TaxID=857340 RepID=A0A086TH01_HAPC1|nr:Transcriptional regulatory protein-like protein [Hapsidospora chrysogenum ATCC 11550]
MKSAKAPSADASSHRRSQPLRQTRTNPPRSSANPARPAAGRQEPPGDQPIDIFPAITFFADTLTALPKELVRQFTLLREVDAKICAPEEQLFELVGAALETTSAEKRSSNGTASANSNAPTLAPMSAPINSNAAALSNNGDLPPMSTADTAIAGLTHDQLILRRRQLFRQISFKIQEILVALEEKNHVIGAANEHLQHQMTRIEDVWPYLENEFSDEAKWGSTTHWAYPENRTGKPTHAERARRDGAATISAAAQAIADEAAARSDARKQALQAKKNNRNNNHQESDFDDPDHRGNKGEGGKKSGQSKVRKTTENSGVGLGISTTANGNPPQKKRKVENATNGGGQRERATSSALGSNTSKAKALGASETSGAEGAKKRKALPSGSGQAKKSRNAMSPSVASSPVIPPLPEPKGQARASPAPSSTPRPTTSRARGNSIQSASDSARSRPPTATSAPTKTNGAQSAAGGEPAAAATSTPRAGSDSRSVKEASVPIKGEAKKEAEKTDAGAPIPQTTTKKETKAEGHERRKSESIPPGQLPPTVTTKSGRASKPSTPALATFQEAARSRPTRSLDSSRKNHKKGGAAAQALAPPTADDDMTSGEGDIDADEPTYCYCNGVSYGEMVACDSDECEREWFHLACVGLKVAPAENSTWYCEDCKKRLKIGNQKGNGR